MTSLFRLNGLWRIMLRHVPARHRADAASLATAIDFLTERRARRQAYQEGFTDGRAAQVAQAMADPFVSHEPVRLPDGEPAMVDFTKKDPIPH